MSIDVAEGSMEMAVAAGPGAHHQRERDHHRDAAADAEEHDDERSGDEAHNDDDDADLPGGGVATMEATVRRRRREQKVEQRRAVHATMLAVQQLLHSVEGACQQALVRRVALTNTVDLDALQKLVDEYDELAVALGVIVV
jgi:hypothetical protein